MTVATDPSRPSADPRVSVAPWPAQEAKDGAFGEAYKLQDQKSEPSRRRRFGVFLDTLEELAGLTLCNVRLLAILPGLHVFGLGVNAYEVGIE